MSSRISIGILSLAIIFSALMGPLENSNSIERSFAIQILRKTNSHWGLGLYPVNKGYCQVLHNSCLGTSWPLTWRYLQKK